MIGDVGSVFALARFSRFRDVRIGTIWRKVEVLSFTVSALAWIKVALNSVIVSAVDGGTEVAVEQAPMFWFAMGGGMIGLVLVIPAVLDWLPDSYAQETRDRN